MVTIKGRRGVLKRLYKTGFTTLNDSICPHLQNPNQNPSFSTPFRDSNKTKYRYRQISGICQKPAYSLPPPHREKQHRIKQGTQVRGVHCLYHIAKFQKSESLKLGVGGGGWGFKLCEGIGAVGVLVDRDVCLWFHVLLIFLHHTLGFNLSI